MTFKEIDWRLTAISNRQEQDHELNAILHGFETKSKKKDNLPALDDENSKILDQILSKNVKGKIHGH